MIVEQAQRIALLQQIHVFNDLTKEDLSNIARLMREVHLSKGRSIFKTDQPADALFFICSGKIRIVRQEIDMERQLAVLVKGDYFGEGAMKAGEPRRNATAVAVGDVTLLVLTREDLLMLLRTNLTFRRNLEISVQSRRLAHRLNFKWVRENEVIHFVARKHWMVLLTKLIIPLLLAIAGTCVFIWWSSPEFSVWVGSLLILAGLGLGVWNWIDWSNDYYVISNQRIVWVEKVIALYDSSVESPLDKIRTVNVETSVLGRLLDFGDLIVYTFVGRIVFHNIPHPFEARIFVEEQRAREEEIIRTEEVKGMNAAIRSRLFPDREVPVPPRPVAPSPAVTAAAPIKEKTRLGGPFSLRFEDKETITYRKHTFVLIKQAGLPALMCILLMAVLGIWLGAWLNSLSNPQVNSAIPIGLFLLWLVAFLGFAGWTVYQYVDWRNDIFQVSLDQIFDIDKTPLGREERKSAPLENILSTEHKRIGILQLFFNYGTVYITIGREESLAFEDVVDPASVKQDIDRRRLASIARKEEQRMSSDKDRLADFFADFYHSSDEYRQQEDAESGDDDNEVQ